MPSVRSTPSQVSMGKKPMPSNPPTTNSVSNNPASNPNTGGGGTNASSPPVKSARAASKAPAIPSSQPQTTTPTSTTANAKGKGRSGAGGTNSTSGGDKDKGKNNPKIWSTSTLEERERIRDFWLGLGEEERRNLVKIEKDTVLRKMKEQQKHSCSCAVCGRKRSAIEEELEVLYDAYYDELEAYANYQQRYVSSGGTLPPPPGPGPFPGSVEVDKHGTVVGANPSIAQYAEGLRAMQQQQLQQQMQNKHPLSRKSRANARKKQKKKNRKMQQHVMPMDQHGIPVKHGTLPPPPGILPNNVKGQVHQRMFHDGSDPGASDAEDEDEDEYEESDDEDHDQENDQEHDMMEDEDEEVPDSDEDEEEMYEDEHGYQHRKPPHGRKDAKPQQRLVQSNKNGAVKNAKSNNLAPPPVPPPTATKPNAKYNNPNTPLFTLPSLTISGPGNILTVADDLLKNDGQKFLEMMEQLAERRMIREDEAVNDIGGSSDSEDPDDDQDDDRDDDDDGDYEQRRNRRRRNEGSEDEDGDEDDEDQDSDGEDGDSEEASEEEESEEEEPLTDLQKMEEGKRMFNIFAARMFEQRVLQAYREKVASERQLQLLRELEDEDKLEKQRLERKEREREKKKDKKKQQKQMKESSKAQKAAEKAASEAALKSQQAQIEAQQKAQREADRARREAEKESAKKAAEEEKARKEEERRKRLEKEREREREREAEKERKRKEREEREAKEREERERKEKERREREEREAKERKEKEEKERKERERIAAEKAAAKKEKEEKEKLAAQQQQKKSAASAQRTASGSSSKSTKASGSVNAIASSSSSISNTGGPGSKKILPKSQGVVGATVNAITPATASLGGPSSSRLPGGVGSLPVQAFPAQPVMQQQQHPMAAMHSRPPGVNVLAVAQPNPLPQQQIGHNAMLNLPNSSAPGSSQPNTPLSPHHPNMMMHQHHPAHGLHAIGGVPVHPGMLNVGVNQHMAPGLGMSPMAPPGTQMYPNQAGPGMMNHIPQSASSGAIVESPRINTQGIFSANPSATGLPTSVSVPAGNLARSPFGVPVNGAFAPAPPLTPGPSNSGAQSSNLSNTPISPIGPPGKQHRRTSVPIAGGLEGAFSSMNLASGGLAGAPIAGTNLGPISRPTPIARPHANSSASAQVGAIGAIPVGAIGEGSSGGGSPRRSPSPKPIGHGHLPGRGAPIGVVTLGSSALVADDDEVVSAGGRRPPNAGPIGNASPWGTTAPAAPGQLGRSGSISSPWSNTGPASFGGRLVPPPSLSNAGIWGSTAPTAAAAPVGGRNLDWNNPASYFATTQGGN